MSTNTIGATFRKDGNWQPIMTLGLQASKTITYDGTAKKGLAGANAIFTVTGDVAVKIFAVCSTLLDTDGAATIEVGITGNTASLIAQTTATAIDAGEIWYDGTPVTVGSIAMSTWNILTNGTDINEKVTTANITAGVLKYYCFWVPLSDDANLVAV